LIAGLACCSITLLATRGGDRQPEPTPKVRFTLKGHTASINDLAFTPNGDILASASDDKTVRLWDVPKGAERGVLPAPDGFVNALAFAADDKTLAWAGNGGTVTLWDVAAGRERTSFEVNPDGRAFAVALSPDGKAVATDGETTGAGDKGLPAPVRLWDAATGKERGSLTGHARRVNCVAFSPNGKLLASGSDDRTVRLWDVSAGKEVGTLKGHTGVVWSVDFAPDGRTLASGGWDGAVRPWQVPGGKRRATLSEPGTVWAMAVAFAGDGKTLVSGSIAPGRGKPGRVTLWDPAAERPRASVPGSLGPVAKTADGGTLAAVVEVAGEPVVRLFDLGHVPPTD
jgi:WD40 repeat protein